MEQEQEQAARYGAFERAQDRAAYEGLRDLVLARAGRTVEAIDLHAIGEELDVETRCLEHALVRLHAESLVIRDEWGTYRASPLTVELADGLFDARTAIEIGVIDSRIDEIALAELAVLEDFARQLASIVKEPLPDLARFLATSHDYHTHLVGLAHSQPLTEAYLRLGISKLWRASIADLDWWNLFDVQHHTALTAALRERDRKRAKALVYEHHLQVKTLVRDVIRAGGGSL
ncbi:FCD domain-containing protein [Agromyces albus]|nr:FCD domain-containing protein [Agromyces albus]